MPKEIEVFDEEYLIKGLRVIAEPKELEALAARVVEELKYVYSLRAGESEEAVLIMGFKDEEVVMNTLRNVGVEVKWKVLGDEGYVLVVDKVKDRVTILCAAATAKGVFYATRTLRQLLKSDEEGVRICKCIIKDWPSFKLRGIVEGFYFRPWSFEERMRIIEIMGNLKMNLYIYAPKEDPYHRAKWREGYDKETMEKFRQLVTRARDHGVEFVIAISPGLTVKYSSEEDLHALCKKLDEFAKVGVRWFAVFFDDIPPFLVHEEDKKRFKSLGEAQAYFLNEVYKYLKEKYPDCTLIMCPTEYFGARESTYLKDLRESLEKEILVFWTGPTVCSVEINREQARLYAKLIGRKPLIWDNYPVNDYARNWINLGPVRNRERTLHEEVEGLLSNPMNEAYASIIAIATIADYTWNPEAYDPEKSWRRALKLVVEEEGVKYLMMLADLTGWSTIWPRRPKIADYLKEVISRARRNEDIEGLVRSIRLLAQDMVICKRKLEELIVEEGFKHDIEPYLRKVKVYGKAILTALDLLEVKEAEKAWELLCSLWKLMKEAERTAHAVGHVPLFKEAEWVMTSQDDYVDYFLWSVIEFTCERFNWPDVIARPFCRITHHEDEHSPLMMVDGNLTTCFRTEFPLRNGDYIELDMLKINKIDGVRIVQMDYMEPHRFLVPCDLQISKDGRRWETVYEVKSGQVEVRGLNTECRYLRLLYKGVKPVKASLREFKVLSGTILEVSTNMAPEYGYYIENIVDGMLLTAFRSREGPRRGDWILIDLGTESNIELVRIFQDMDLHFIRAKLLTSVDGENWKLVSIIDEPYAEVKLDADEVRYIKLESDYNHEWPVVIYEIQVLKSTGKGSS